MADQTNYITVPIEADPDALVQEAVEFIQEQFPDWVPSDGNFETILLEAIGSMAADLNELASSVPSAIFRYYGQTIVNVPPIDESAASASTTWTMVDNAGYTIPAGTLVGIPSSDSADEFIAFETVDEITVAPGSTTTGAGEVVLQAVEPGEEGSGLTGTPTLIDSLASVSSIALVGETTGGTDGESDDDYISRLSQELTLLSPRPILPNDFAVLAKRIPGVYRATAIDGYNPTGPLTGQERTVSVALMDTEGAAVNGTIKTEVDDYLQAQREVNFDVFVIDPAATAIDVDFDAKCYSQFDPATVEAAAIAALEDYLSPAKWGQSPVGDETDWLNTDKVRYFEVAEVLNRVDGLWYVTALTVEGGTSDVTLTGAAPVATPGTITGDVTL